MLPLGAQRALALGLLALPLAATSQNDGYLGYLLNQKGDPESAVYRTENTDTAPNFLLPETPDVYLNATVNVESIRVHVANLVAKVDLDAKVLDLLHFSAGVDASIERVELKIDDVYARAELEARLGNVVRIVDCVLGSIELNPLVASLGQNVGKVVGAATDVVGDMAQGVLGGGGGKAKPGGPARGPDAGAGGGAPTKPPPPGDGSSNPGPPSTGEARPGDTAPEPQSPPLKPAQQPLQQAPQQNPQENQQQNQNRKQKQNQHLLYWYNDGATNNRVNHVLDQNGDILEVRLDAWDNELYRSVIGWYKSNMDLAGGPWAVTNNWGQTEYASDYNFFPAPGLKGSCRVWQDTSGRVIRTEVLRDGSGSGS